MRLPHWFTPFALSAAVVATIAPVAAYTVSLALAGAWHVHVELGWVRERMGARLVWALAPLGAIAALRLAAYAGRAPPWAIAAELTLGAGLVIATIPALPHTRARLVAAGVGASFAAGIVASPLATLVLFALLHNLTPLGFFADRGVRMALPTALFVGLPALAALVPIEQAFDPAGPARAHLGAFVPPGAPPALEAPLFRAAVTAQLLHYGAVIGVLGAWRGARPRAAEAMAAVGSTALFAYFAVEFNDARRLYGAVAAVHAWIELPGLLLALGGGLDPYQVSQAPTLAEKPFAAAEIASARRGGTPANRA